MTANAAALPVASTPHGRPSLSVIHRARLRPRQLPVYIHADDAHVFSLVSEKRSGGQHDNYGSALSAHPGKSQGRPDIDLELAVHFSATACPHLRAPGAPRPGSREPIRLA